MYFDTLKVNSTEQSASQTSARGGYKNPELITWDFGKEININLTDALYSPASISLMWGGKFGSKQAEIDGFWNPIHQEEDDNKQTYLVTEVVNEDKETRSKLAEVRPCVRIYQEIIQKMYERILQDEEFLSPQIMIDFREMTKTTPAILHRQFSYILNSNVTKELIGKSVIQIREEDYEQLYLKVVETHSEDFNFEEYNYIKEFGYTPYYKVSDEGAILIESYVNYFNIIMGEYGLTTPDIPVIFPIHDNNYEALSNMIDKDTFYFLRYVEFTDIVSLKKLMNKDLYSLDAIFHGMAERVFYELIKQNTSYKTDAAARSYFNLDDLLTNYRIYYSEEKQKEVLDIIIDEEDIRSTSFTYEYTSQYLGWDKEDIHYPYILNITEQPVSYRCNKFQPTPKMIGQPAERAKLILNNFSDFSVKLRKKGVNYNDFIVLHDTGNNGEINFNNAEREIFYDYEWKDCEVQMISLQGKQDIYYGKHIDILYRVDSLTFEKKLLVKRSNDNSFYDSQIDLYKNINDEEIKVGTFYINDDFNYDLNSENSIYPIEDGLAEIPFLDRIEKCTAKDKFCIDTDKNYISNSKKDLPQYAETQLAVYLDPKTMKPYQSNSTTFTRKNGEEIYGNLKIFNKGETYYRFTRTRAKKNQTLGQEILVNASSFPGTYRLVGETKTRARIDGKDSYLQIDIPLCSVTSSSTLELSADGEPTTFNMTIKVLQNEKDEMIKFRKYEVVPADYDSYESNSTNIKPVSGKYEDNYCIPCSNPVVTYEFDSSGADMEILLPLEDDYFCIPIDCLPPFSGRETYLALPKTNEEAIAAYRIYQKYQELLNSPIPTDEQAAAQREQEIQQYRNALDTYRGYLLIKAPLGGASIFLDGVFYKIAYEKDYEGNIQESGNAGIEIIDGKPYRIEIISQENISKFSPITFTITGEGS